MDYQRKHDWRSVIRAVDPGAESRITEFISYTVQRESALSRKHKELFLMACGTGSAREYTARPRWPMGQRVPK